jgi:hypothetical protein
MTAVARCSALDDREDDPPHHYLRAMPENDDREITETLAPPTDREAPTNPENPRPVHRNAVLPQGAGLNPYAQKPDWWDGSFFQSIFNDVQGAAEAHRRVAAGQDEILAAIQAADRNSNRNYELIRDEIRHLKDSDLKQDQRLKEGDRRFEQIEQSIKELKDELIALVTREMKSAAEKIEVLEKQLLKAKADAAGSTEASTATT